MQFIGLYIISLVLIVAVVIAFWQGRIPPTPPEKTEKGSDNADYLMQAETLLHNRLEAVDAACVAYLNGEKRGMPSVEEKIKVASHELKVTLDSMDRIVQNLQDASKKEMLTVVVNRSKKTLENKNTTIACIFQLIDSLSKPKVEEEEITTQPKLMANNTKALDELKQILADKENVIADLKGQQQKGLQEKEKALLEKDKQIAYYQNQLKQKQTSPQTINTPVQNTSGITETEWQQKYAAMKSSYDKALARENNLKAAYKTVVDDNRRLLSQIQTLKGN